MYMALAFVIESSPAITFAGFKEVVGEPLVFFCNGIKSFFIVHVDVVGCFSCSSKSVSAFSILTNGFGLLDKRLM